MIRISTGVAREAERMSALEEDFSYFLAVLSASKVSKWTTSTSIFVFSSFIIARLVFRVCQMPLCGQ